MKTKTLIAKIAAAAAVSLGVSAFADTYTDAKGIEWTYEVLDSTAHTVVLGAATTSSETAAVATTAQFAATDIPWTFTDNDVDYTVVSIGRGAFNNCNESGCLTGTLTFPDSVTNIGQAAFCYCSNITEIEFNSNIKSIGANAFGYGNNGCVNAKVTNFDLSGCTVIGDTAFGALSRGYILSPQTVTYDSPVNLKLNSSESVSLSKAFVGSKVLMDVMIPRNITTIVAQTFNNSNVMDFFMPGPAVVESGTQTYATIGRKEQFNWCTSIQLAFFGPTVKPSGTEKSMFNNDGNRVTTKIYAPYEHWNGSTWANTGTYKNDVTLYGPGQAIDFAIDDDVTTLTATPTTEAALVDILEEAPVFKKHFNIDTKICVTNAIELSATPLVTKALIENASVTFDSLTFAVKTQTELDYVLDAVPESVTLVLDPTGATETLTVPLEETTRKVYMLLPPGASYERKKNGLIIIFK